MSYIGWTTEGTLALILCMMPVVLAAGFYLGWTWGKMRGADDMVKEIREKITLIHR